MRMKRRTALLLALLCFFGALAAPGRAHAQDALKNEDPELYYILLDLNNQIVTVFERDEEGEYTKIVRRFLCSSGRTDIDEEDPEDEATPTPRGIWKIGGRERFGKFANFGGEYARYWVQIVGSIFFHSVLFGDRTVNSLKRSAYGNIGSNVSHGCVRLYVEDAKWLYYYACPGTTIEVSTSEKRDSTLKKALKNKMSYSEYNAFQKTITDDKAELPNDRAWVTVEDARLRKGSGATFDSISRLEVGTELEVLLKGEVWVKVRYGKREGYVKRGYITYTRGVMDTKKDATLLKTTEWIYVEPDAGSERICKVPAQASIKVLETREDGWTKLKYWTETGYVRTSRIVNDWGAIMN